MKKSGFFLEMYDLVEDIVNNLVNDLKFSIQEFRVLGAHDSGQL